MTTVTLQKNYKKLENRLGAIERILKVFMGDELSSSKVRKLELLSKKLDEGAGKRFGSHRAFSQYVKSL